MGVTVISTGPYISPDVSNTFGDAVCHWEDELPLLARAAKNEQEAVSTKIEWLEDGKTLHNFTQIVRYPFRSNTSPRDACRAFLGKIDEIVENGVCRREETAYGAPISYCGGWRHYIPDRDLHDLDVIAIRPLRTRGPRLWVDNFRYDSNHGKHGVGWFPEWAEGVSAEWITEFSLEVRRYDAGNTRSTADR